MAFSNVTAESFILSVPEAFQQGLKSDGVVVRKGSRQGCTCRQTHVMTILM